MKVLLIEDDLVYASLVEQLLASEAGNELSFEWVESLRQGIARVREASFDVLLVDLFLPDSQGINTLVRLQQTAVSLPLIVLTGSDDDRLALEILRLGAQDYLVKGRIDKHGLARAIRYAIERKRNELRLQQQRQRQAALHEINIANTSAVNLWSALQTFVEQVDMVLPRLGIALWLHNDETGRCEPIARWKIGADEWRSSALGRSPELIDSIARSDSLSVIDLKSEKGDLIAQSRYGSCLGMPLSIDGERLGVLGFFVADHSPCTGDDNEFLTVIASQAAVTVHKSRLFNRSRSQAARLDQAQREIRNTENKYQELIDNIDAIVWEADPQTGSFLYVSKAAEQKLGFPTKRWLEEADFRVFLTHPDDRARSEEFYRTAVERDKAQDIEYRIVAADGRIVWLRDIVRVVHGDKQQITLLRGVMIDITQAKEAEAALQRRSAEILHLQEIGQKILDTEDVRGAIESILELAMNLVGCQLGAVRILAPMGGLGKLTVRGYQDSESVRLLEESIHFHPQKAGENIFARILESKKTHVFDHIAAIPEFTALRREGAVAAIIVPIIAQDAALGLLSVAIRQAPGFHSNQIDLLEILARQIGIVIQKAALFEEARSHLGRIQALRQFERSMVSTLDLHDVLTKLLDKIESLYPFPAAATVRLVDQDTHRLRLSHCRNFDSEKWQKSHGSEISPVGIAGAVIRARAPIAAADLANDPRVRDREFNRREGLVSYLGVPLIVRDNVVGLLEILLRQKYVFPAHEIDYISSLASHAAIAIENAYQYTALDKNTQELAALLDVTSAASHSLEMPQILREVAQKIGGNFNFAATEIYLFDDSRKKLHIRTNLKISAETTDPVKMFDKGTSIIGHVGETGEVVLIGDIETDDRYAQLSRTKVAKSHGYRSLACFPIKGKAGILGVLLCLGRRCRDLSEHEVQLISLMTHKIGAAVENTRRYERARAQGDQFRDLATHLETAREQERTRIAREIHDELGQLLTALKLDFSWLRGKICSDDPLQSERFAAVSDTLDITLQSVRKISTQLRPDVLDKLGLAAAIEWQLQEFRKRTGTRYFFTSDPADIRIDDERTTAIFRIFQEALTNAARHAKASRVKINLELKKGRISLRVEDNGIGIDTRRLHESKSLGLLGIRERAASLGGTVKITKNQRFGTTVLVYLPLDNQVGDLRPNDRKQAI